MHDQVIEAMPTPEWSITAITARATIATEEPLNFIRLAAVCRNIEVNTHTSLASLRSRAPRRGYAKLFKSGVITIMGADRYCWHSPWAFLAD
eukprot:TRINITY_DN7769_c0_g1_i1.p2 TRINITY_DN7769_c0_g1~~TRINITY_DN7769_c0_g1_i1.p2  ORF type:complete len:100 (+),score=2.22 TRINITY_DN7769_c0_g1_i1:26-301(+)